MKCAVFVLVLTLICLEVLGQAPFGNTVKICAVACSDGSTYAECFDTFSGPSVGDCYYSNLQCPTPLETVSFAYDFGSGQGLAFRSVADCQDVFDSLRKSPNLPAVVSDKVPPPNISVRSLKRSERAIKEALEWHEDFSMYTDQEQLLLGQRIIAAKVNPAPRSYTDEEVRDLARMMFGFVQSVRENTNNTGVYTNSKCAGCSLIVQSIQEKLTASVCDSLYSVIQGGICGTNPVFQIFCDAVMSAVNFDKFIESVCVSAFNGVVDVSGIKERANYICSALTCTSEPDEITKEEDIMGSCIIDSDTQKSLNERCDELLQICDLVEKGICIKDAIVEIHDAVSGGFIEAGLDAIASLVKGELPDVVSSVKKAATECCNVKCGGVDPDDPGNPSKSTMANPLLSVGLAVLMLSLFVQF